MVMDYFFPNGDKYTGEVKDGKYHGEGTATSSNGNIYIGEWKVFEPWNIKVYDKRGSILEKYMNGEKVFENYELSKTSINEVLFKN